MRTTSNKMADLNALKPFQKRVFVPDTADLTDPKIVEKLYGRLTEASIVSKDELEAWVLKRSELDAALDQQGAVLYIRMTCQTDNAKRAKDYQNFIEQIVPLLRVFDDRLNRKFADALAHFPLDDKRYGIYTRAIQNDLELFREDNVKLKTKLDLLSQEYQRVCGAMTVDFDGQERTMQQMGKLLTEPDRELRERAWRASAKRRLADRERLEGLFNEMVALRDTVGTNAGFANFRDYQFRALHRFDYGPADCRQYHETIERVVVPLWRTLQERRRELMGLDSLRPWDTEVDPLGRSPLKPFDNVDRLVDGCREIFMRVHPELGRQFAQMADAGLLDLDSRKGKAPGGYQSTLNESRQPFIFMNAVGIDGDVRTLLHEGGHAFHAFASAHDPLYDYRHGPMEFNEVASMGMELIADGHLGVFYGPDDEARSREKHLIDVIYTLVWVAAVDAFQHWVYENPKHSMQERNDEWLSIHNRFGGSSVDWTGLDEEHRALWQRQLHIFEVPFYYIEYGIAQLGALQLWRNAKRDMGGALRQYRAGLALGGSRPLPELFAAAGLSFDFSESMITPLVNEVRDALNA